MAGIVVDRVYERRLAALVNSREQRLIARGRRGLERESLRVTPDGHIAQTPHPRSLGASLTNPHITTDYSEALTELVTPTFDDNEELLQYLGDLHQFVYAHLGEELLWATSMPCITAAKLLVRVMLSNLPGSSESRLMLMRRKPACISRSHRSASKWPLVVIERSSTPSA